ncbi:TPA: hypothetical protein OUI11_003430 [Acinetobacter baumannii]|nr:hypothetical protein [Acinetobacter baumannii]
MNNAQFKIECFRNGLYSPEQLIEFYKQAVEETSFDKRDAQQWMNGKSDKVYLIPKSAIAVVETLARTRNSIIEKVKNQQASGGEIRYKYLFKNEINLWNEYPEFFHLPINVYNSVIVELKIEVAGYYEHL